MTEARDSEGEAQIARALTLSGAALLGIIVLGGIAWLATRSDGDVPAAPEFTPVAPTTPAPVASVPALPFTDVTGSAGITFNHYSGAYGERLLPETMGGGVAFFDYDNDGDPDLLFVNSRAWPDTPAPADARSALYANRGDGTFEDVSVAAGLDLSLYGQGVAVGDYDGDGRRDVYITAVGSNVLLRNTPSGFVDVTTAQGVAGGPDAWSTSAGFLDYDRDGDLDLFVANYVTWTPTINAEVDYRLTGVGRAYGPPTDYAGTNAYLFRNDGGSFTDVSSEAGVEVRSETSGNPVGKGLAVLPADVDSDGWTDLVVANDTVRNFLFINQQDGTFRETGVTMGVAFDSGGLATGAMGIDAAWLPDLAQYGIAIGNFANEMSSFYVMREGGGTFSDDAIVAGIGPASRRALTFGLAFLDLDLDGRQDLIAANGHVEPEINRVQSSQRYAQPTQVFWNCGGACPRSFVAVDAKESSPLHLPRVGRGLAYADIDADGDLDVAITQTGGPAALLRNDQTTGHNWLRLRLAGRPDNRDAIGAEVRVAADGRTQRRFVTPTRGYLSQVELTLTFGLGSAASGNVTVTWPDGAESQHGNLPPNQVHTLRRAP